MTMQIRLKDLFTLDCWPHVSERYCLDFGYCTIAAYVQTKNWVRPRKLLGSHCKKLLLLRRYPIWSLNVRPCLHRVSDHRVVQKFDYHCFSRFSGDKTELTCGVIIAIYFERVNRLFHFFLEREWTHNNNLVFITNTFFN